MRTRIHMCVDVRGVLTNWTRPHQYAGFFKHDDGREMTMAEATGRFIRKHRKCKPRKGVR